MRQPMVYWRSLRREWKWNGWEPTDTGWLLTLSLFLLTLYVGLLQDDEVTKFDQFLSLRPSEMGDTLAGLFSVLAFIWIIVTVFIQSRELREQRKEFKQQREATQDMARAMAAQARIFEGEQKQRDEVQADELLNEKLRSFVMLTSEASGKDLNWVFSDAAIDDEFGGNGHIINSSIGNRDDENLTIDEAIVSMRRRLRGMHEHLWDLMNQSIDYRLPKKSETLPDLIQKLQNAIAMKDSLSLPQRERLIRMDLDNVVFNLTKLYETAELWEEMDS